MPPSIALSRRPADRYIAGDNMRFDGRHSGKRVHVDICLIQWTVLCDQHAEVTDAVEAIEGLTALGRWLTVEAGPPVLFVVLPEQSHEIP